jgi:hypothetical protein
LKTVLDIADVTEGYGTGLPVRRQPNVLIADLEADVIRVVDIGLDAKEFRVERLCPGNIDSGIEDCFDALVHLCGGFIAVGVGDMRSRLTKQN